jgi:nitric oxide dioxygenase
LRVLFTEDPAEQRETLMKMLGMAVANLNDAEALSGVVKEQGRRHVAYGVKPKDYDTVGAALLGMLQLTLGRDFTPNLRQGWIECYLALAAGMLSGLEPESA